MPRRAAVVLVAIVAIAASWMVLRTLERWISPEPIRSGVCGGCNVLLITVDTLRSDRVGAFGGPPGLTPNLDRLAARALRLTRAYSSAPLTLPSHASIMTGTSPPAHGVRANGLFRLGADTPTLATVLKQNGYRTGAFVGAFVLDARFGLNRGFDVYDDRYGEKHAGDDTEGAERRAEDVIKPALAWINQQSPINPQSPIPNPQWFAWVHLYDPHEPYRAPEPYASQHEPYDAEVAYTDAMIGKLLDDLTAKGQLERTLVVVAADHGESLGEHGERTHGVFAYDVTLRVPWLVWARPRITGRRFDGPVRLIDLAPTVMDLVGVAWPHSIEGRSVLQAVNGRDTSGPAAYFEAMDANLTRNWAPLTGVVSGGYKLIDLPIPELYDLAADPGETTNLAARGGENDRVRTLTALLRNTTAELSARGAPAAAVTLNAESRQRLQALGYVASSAGPRPRVYGDVDDPKTLIGASNDLNRALAAFKAGSPREAMSAVRAIIAQHPGFTTASGVLASMQHDTGDLRGAIATLEDLVGREIADQSVMVVLAGYLQEAGALEKSIGILDAVVASHPDYADAYNSLGVAYSRAGRHDRARAAFRRVLDLDPTSATTYENLGVDEAGAGDLGAAAADLARALELDPRLPGAHNALAAVCLRQGRQPDAIAHWKTAVQLDPRMYDALYNLGTVLHSLGRTDEARPYLERFVNEAPPFRYAADIARIRRMIGD